MHRITKSQNKDGSFGDILSTYYAVPTLSGRSFLWICNVCPGKEGKGLSFLKAYLLYENREVYWEEFYQLTKVEKLLRTFILT